MKIKDVKLHEQEDDPNEEVTFNVKVTVRKRQVEPFVKMLRMMQWLGGIGASRMLNVFVDGDGAFRPKFEIDKAHDAEIEELWPDREEVIDKDNINVGLD